MSPALLGFVFQKFDNTSFLQKLMFLSLIPILLCRVALPIISFGSTLQEILIFCVRFGTWYLVGDCLPEVFDYMGVCGYTLKGIATRATEETLPLYLYSKRQSFRSFIKRILIFFLFRWDEATGEVKLRLFRPQYFILNLFTNFKRGRLDSRNFFSFDLISRLVFCDGEQLDWCFFAWKCAEVS